eukprot:662498-Karenia_brevis.AAC.1
MAHAATIKTVDFGATAAEASGEPLQGWSQTNNRAELMAVLRILETDPRRLDIRSDSEYVVEGCSKSWSAPCWDA